MRSCPPSQTDDPSCAPAQSRPDNASRGLRAGHVGLVTGACLAELGHSVVVKDVVEEKVARLESGDAPVHEPDVRPLLARNRHRIRFTTDGEAARVSADMLVVCVDTPPTASGDADLTRVWAVVDDVSTSDELAVLAMKSTVPMGTGRRIRAELDARGDAPVVRTDVNSAEMTKLAANALLVTRISFINEIATSASSSTQTSSTSPGPSASTTAWDRTSSPPE